MYVIINEEGSYDDYRMEVVYLLNNEEEANSIVNLFNDIIKWREERGIKISSLLKEWEKNNPSPDFSYYERSRFLRLRGILRDEWKEEQVKNIKKEFSILEEKNKFYIDWINKREEARLSFLKSFPCPEEFEKFKDKNLYGNYSYFSLPLSSKEKILKELSI